jgi:hypothetical protein
MRSFYLPIRVIAIEKWSFSATYPLVYSDCWSIYMGIHYMGVYFWSPYLSHMTRSTSTQKSNFTELFLENHFAILVISW